MRPERLCVWGGGARRKGSRVAGRRAAGVVREAISEDVTSESRGGRSEGVSPGGSGRETLGRRAERVRRPRGGRGLGVSGRPAWLGGDAPRVSDEVGVAQRAPVEGRPLTLCLLFPPLAHTGWAQPARADSSPRLRLSPGAVRAAGLGLGAEAGNHPRRGTLPPGADARTASLGVRWGPSSPAALGSFPRRAAASTGAGRQVPTCSQSHRTPLPESSPRKEPRRLPPPGACTDSESPSPQERPQGSKRLLRGGRRGPRVES